MNIKNVFKSAVDMKASDIHLTVGLPVMFRVNGELINADENEAITGKEMEQGVFSLISNEQKNDFVETRELDFGINLNGNRFRVNIYYGKDNIGLVARVINEKMPTLKELNMPDVITNLLKLKQGLILVTGPTGCGKSTALASMINYINSNRRCNIVTMEDPIEYIFKPEKSIVVQRQLGSDTLSFPNALKHVLRQDPDVIMVGEMRDLETIGATITLAETGHLVLATLHTYSAAQTIDRIIDIFPPHQQNQVRMQLSMTLVAVISQRLLNNVQGKLIAAREILINTPAVSNLIRENKISQIRTVIETSSREGMVSMDQDLKRLYKEKIINKESAQNQMLNPEMLEKLK